MIRDCNGVAYNITTSVAKPRRALLYLDFAFACVAINNQRQAGRPFGASPSHFRMRAWSFAVLARNSSLQPFRQKRMPQCWWHRRPNFPPQYAQRFSNLVRADIVLAAHSFIRHSAPK